MQKLVLFILMFLSTCLFAQSIKVKRGIVFLDKKNEVAKVDEIEMNDRKVQAFTNINNPKDTVYIDVYTHLNDEKNKYFQWAEVSYNGRSTEVNLVESKFTLNSGTRAARQLYAMPELLTKEGLNFKNIADFVAKNQTSTAKVDWENYKESKKEGEQIVQEAQIFVNEAGEVFAKKGIDNQIIGKVKTSGSLMRIFDLDELLIATFDRESNKIKITGGEEFEPTKKLPFITGRYDRNKGLEAEKIIVEQIYAKGFYLGNQKKKTAVKQAQEAANKRIEKVQELRKASNNFYNMDGVVYDKDGEVWNGRITLLFEDIPEEDEINGKWGSMEELNGDNFGKRLNLQYEKKPGKLRAKSFRSKNGVRFCLNTTKECYLGFSVKGSGAMVVAGGLSSLSFDTSAFHREIDVREAIGLYQAAIDPDIYMLKKAKDKKGMVLKRNRSFANEEKDAAKDKKSFVDYFSDCNKVAKAYNSYDLTTLEGIKIVLDDYQTCKQ